MIPIAIIDFETTGLSAGTDRIIEVAAVVIGDDGITATFSQLMDPGVYIPAFITGLTGISNAMVRGKPRPESVMPRLRAFLGEHACVAHNASFDQRFFTAEMDLAGQRHERPFVCTLMLARRLLQRAPTHQLGTLARVLNLAKPAGMQAHRALADVLMTYELWKHLTALVSSRMNGQVAGVDVMRAIQRKSKALTEPFLTRLASVRPTIAKTTSNANGQPLRSCLETKN